MLNELEQKIRKAIPELNELGETCEILLEHFNGTFKTKNVYCVFNRKIYFDDEIFCHIEDFDRYFNKEQIIGKPIQLNHVLEYLKILGCFNTQLLRVSLNWNLKSNLLSDQSIEVIKFVNELKKD